MTPLIRECNSSDTLIVAINLVERPATPRSAQTDKSSEGSVEFSQVAANGSESGRANPKKSLRPLSPLS